MTLQVQHLKSPTVEEALVDLQSRLSPISDAPAQEARTILEHAAGLSWARILSRPQLRLTEESTERAETMVMRRLAGEPLAYVIGRVEFCGIGLSVDRRALIPRPETELMAELVRRIYSFADATPRLAIDLGTGSGCLALALAGWFPHCTVIASDLSPAALSLAQENLARARMRNLHLVAGDCLAPFRTSFDLVAANLPYVPDSRLSGLSPEVIRHEPPLALNGGPDGLEIYRRVFSDLPVLFADDGVLAFEMDESNVATGASLLRDLLPTRPVSVFTDQFGRNRFLIAAPMGMPVTEAARSLSLELVEP